MKQEAKSPTGKQSAEDDPPEEEVDPNDPMLTVPLPRYNAMLAVLRNTLYMYARFPCLASNTLFSSLLSSSL